MKRNIFIAVLGVVAVSGIAAYGQGKINFSNYTSSTQTGGFITYASGSQAGKGVGPEITVELLYGPSGSTLTSQLGVLTYNDGIGDQSPVAAGLGVVSSPGPTTSGGAVTGDGLFSGGAVALGSYGTTYAFELEAFGTFNSVSYIGYSAIANGTIQTSSSSGIPNLPGALLSGFTVAPVPEPATLALAGLGGAALLAFRRKKV
jgi:hypothetical protein